MRDSIGRGIEWCENWGRPITCYCEEIYRVDTKCPDLGDWSDTPHDELDNLPIQIDGLTGLAWFDCGLKELASRVARIQKKRLIELDRERLMAYTYD
jgi:hypothetical protein